MTSPQLSSLECVVLGRATPQGRQLSLMEVVPGPKMGVLDPSRGPRGGNFNPILTGNLLKTTKNHIITIMYTRNRTRLHRKHIFTLEIPINTLVPTVHCVVIGNPSDNPHFGPQVLKMGQKYPFFGVFLGYFWGKNGAPGRKFLTPKISPPG